MADLKVKLEPSEPVLLAVTAHPKLEIGIDGDTNSEQSDDEPILMSVKQEMLEQNHDMVQDIEVRTHTLY